jgi:hypothetical protein
LVCVPSGIAGIMRSGVGLPRSTGSTARSLPLTIATPRPGPFPEWRMFHYSEFVRIPTLADQRSELMSITIPK